MLKRAGSNSGALAARAAAAPAADAGASKRRLPKLEDFVDACDFVGARTLLEFQLRADEREGEDGAAAGGGARGRPNPKALEWLAWVCFHNGDYDRCLEAYDQLLALPPSEVEAACGATVRQLRVSRACCLYYLGRYAEAEKDAEAGADCPLRTRLLFHVCHKQGKESAVREHHSRLSPDSKEDQLTLAAMHFARAHYQDAMEVYKRLVADSRDDAALSVYIALCHYKMDYYDFSSDVLGTYMQSHPSSPFAVNLRACNQFKLFNGRAAEAELKLLTDAGYSLASDDLMRHNLVVFRGGEAAPSVLPPLMGSVPEARLNLIIYHLRSGALNEAAALLDGFDPTTPPEYILLATVHTALAQQGGTGSNAAAGGAGARGRSGSSSAPAGMLAMSSREHLKAAQQLFQTVGASPSERDTIPGRQSMACAYFLLRQFADVQLYTSSIAQYLAGDDDFLWNHGMSLVALGRYAEAEEALSSIRSPSYTAEFVYTAALARCLIMNRKARAAWELYLGMNSAAESIVLLQLIANDCYRTGAFYFAAKAFDVLERLEPSDVSNWEGKRGACAGVLQSVMAGTEGKEALREVISMLRATPAAAVQPAAAAQADALLRVLTRWAQASGG